MARNEPFRLLRILVRTIGFRLECVSRGRRFAWVPWADHGFFANFRAIVHSIYDYESVGKCPVVVSSRYAFERYDGAINCGHNLYWSRDGDHGSFNTWEYYFTPVSGVEVNFEFLAVRNIKRTLDHPCFLVRDSGFIREYRRNGYMNAHWARVHGLRDYPTPEYRRLMNDIIMRHIRLKPRVWKEVDRYHASCMAGREVLGVHVRKGDQEGNEVIPTSLTDFFAIIDEHERFEYIYLATDCRVSAECFRERYGERLLVRDVRRTGGTEGVHLSAETIDHRPQLGEEVLIDALLLVRCGWYVHGNSNMNFPVLCWNPRLPHTNVYSVLGGAKNPTFDGGHQTTGALD